MPLRRNPGAPRPTLLRRALVSFAAVLVGLATIAPVAAADPAKPGNYKSVILSVSPATSAISLKVVGGDGFLEIHVKRGHTVSVAGYENEPWMQVLADGTVQTNALSPATYLDANRYATKVPPPGATAAAATATPDWITVAHGGAYIWHDHRIHWMTPQNPPRLVPGTNRVYMSARTDGEWQVPMHVDGRPVTATGELLLYSAPSPAAPYGLAGGIVLVVVGLAFARRTIALPLSTVVVALGALAGVYAGWHELAVVPTQAGGNPVAVALPAAALIAAILSVVLRNTATRVIAVLAGAAALLAWALLRIAALDKAVPLSNLHPSLARMLIAATLGAAIAGAVASVRSGGLALAPFDLDDDDEHVPDEEPPSPPLLTTVEDA